MKTSTLSLANNALFENISEKDRESLLECLSAQQKNVETDSYVFRIGDEVKNIFLIISGTMHIVDDDYWGNRSIIETMEAGVLFGEAYVFSSRTTYLVGVVAAEDSVVLEINPKKLFETCSNDCACHQQLMKNTLFIVSEKIVRLTEKVGHISKRSTREKVLSYLSNCAQKAQSNVFDIPYSRQQLADYLCVDRSALSHELSRLSKLGLISFRKNRFELLNDDHVDIYGW